MIQYFRDLSEQVDLVKASHLNGGQIQKIYSTAFYVSLSIRTPGKTWHLYLGRGGGHEGAWLHDSPPPSEIRRKDTFLEYLRRYLSACTFLSLELDQSDRIIKLSYQKYGQRESLLLFWRARKLYFSHLFRESPEAPQRLLLSWQGKSTPVGEDLLPLFEYFNDVGRRTDHPQDLRSKVFVSITELLENEKKAAFKDQVVKASFLQRKRANIEEDLRKNQQWDKLQAMLDRGDSLDDYYELKVGDHKIKFEGELNPYERRNLLFEKIKKLKRGESIMSERLKALDLKEDNKAGTSRPAPDLPIIRPVWGKEVLAEGTPKKNSPEQTDYKIFQFEEFQAGVGMNARGNDQLRNKWAGKEDTWVHLDGLKSAHVVLKVRQGAAVSPVALNTAATIVAHFSHFQGDWIPIIYTQVKNVKGVTGAPGMVIYKKEKHLRCPPVEADFLKDPT